MRLNYHKQHQNARYHHNHRSLVTILTRNFYIPGVQEIRFDRQEHVVEGFRTDRTASRGCIQEDEVDAAAKGIGEEGASAGSVLRRPFGTRDAHQHAQHDLHEVHRQQSLLLHSWKGEVAAKLAIIIDLFGVLGD